ECCVQSKCCVQARAFPAIIKCALGQQGSGVFQTIVQGGAVNKERICGRGDIARFVWILQYSFPQGWGALGEESIGCGGSGADGRESGGAPWRTSGEAPRGAAAGGGA